MSGVKGMNKMVSLPTEWMERGLCWNTAPDGADKWEFFPNTAEQVLSKADSLQAYEDARRLCRLCEVSDECLDYALQSNQLFGMWGGKTPKERLRIRRKGRAA